MARASCSPRISRSLKRIVDRPLSAIQQLLRFVAELPGHGSRSHGSAGGSAIGLSATGAYSASVGDVSQCIRYRLVRKSESETSQASALLSQPKDQCDGSKGCDHASEGDIGDGRAGVARQHADADHGQRVTDEA